MRSFSDCRAGGTHRKILTIGVLNIMPSCDREATEKMFERRFKGSGVPHEVVWLHPEAGDPGFQHTGYEYKVPGEDAYDRIDYLFRSGADAEFIAPEDNRYLGCLRESYAFDKGSTSLCWSAAQLYADATGQGFADLLIGRDEYGEHRKRSGYYDYDMMEDMGLSGSEIPSGAYMACSRHFKVDALKEMQKARRAGFRPIAISKIGNDIAGFTRGDDILLFTHNEYDPARLYVETERCIARASSDRQKQSLRDKFPNFQSYEQAADGFGQNLFAAILKQAYARQPAFWLAPEAALKRAYA